MTSPDGPLSPKEEYELIGRKWANDLMTPDEARTTDQSRAVRLRGENLGLADNIATYIGALALSNPQMATRSKIAARMRLITIDRMGIEAPQICADDSPPPELQPWEQESHESANVELDIRHASTLHIAEHVARSWMLSVGVRYYSYASGQKEVQPLDLDDTTLSDMDFLEEAIDTTYYLLAHDGQPI